MLLWENTGKEIGEHLQILQQEIILSNKSLFYGLCK
jgi:hypothetical protein